jgi:hypothetical protein
MRKNPIRCVRSPLPESFEEDMNRIKEEREKLIQEISDKCITASVFSRIYQDKELNTKKKENYKE